jgi:hypothetical protein
VELYRDVKYFISQGSLSMDSQRKNIRLKKKIETKDNRLRSLDHFLASIGWTPNRDVINRDMGTIGQKEGLGGL